MIGNCAHCHNPRGLPSVTKPELSTALNFMPDGKDGGVFEFPLERMSPVRQRGAGGDVPIPYITPSLRDYPVANIEDSRMDNGLSLNTGLPGVEITWTPKYPQKIDARNCEDLPKQKTDHERALLRAYCGSRTTGFALDCRTLAEPDLPERGLTLPVFRRLRPVPAHADEHVRVRLPRPAHHGRLDGRAAGRAQISRSPRKRDPSVDAKRGDGSYDDRPQPFQEVKADDPRYPMAVAQSQVRLAEYHATFATRIARTCSAPTSSIRLRP